MSQRKTALAPGGVAWCRASTLRQMGAAIGPDVADWLQVRLLGRVGGEGERREIGDGGASLDLPYNPIIFSHSSES